jgi:hypothetical protein
MDRPACGQLPGAVHTAELVRIARRIQQDFSKITHLRRQRIARVAVGRPNGVELRISARGFSEPGVQQLAQNVGWHAVTKMATVQTCLATCIVTVVIEMLYFCDKRCAAVSYHF